MAKAQLDFSGARGIIDPLEGLKTSMQQTNSTLGQMIVQDEAQKQQDLTRAREARQDALNTPGTPEWVAAQQAQQEMKISGMDAEQKWKAENDLVYQNALLVMKRETPGSPEWNDAQKIIQNMNMSNKLEEYKLKRLYDPSVIAQFQALDIAKKDIADQEHIGKQFFALPTEKVTTTTVTPEDLQKVKEQAESATTTNAGAKYNLIYDSLVNPKKTPINKSIKIEGDIINGFKATPTTQLKMTPEKAHVKALKESGLQDLLDNGTISIDPSIILPKVGTTSKEEKYTDDERTQLKLDLLKKGVDSGKISARLAMEVATKLQPVKSAKEKLEEKKFGLDVLEFNEKQRQNYYGKNGLGGSGKGNWIKTYDAMITTYGDPGKYDRPSIEKTLSDLQGTKYSDSEMSDAIEAARGTYGGSFVGVDEIGFTDAVKTYLEKLPPKEKK